MDRGLCTPGTAEPQRSSHSFLHCRPQLTRGTRHHSTPVSAALARSLKPTNQIKKTFHCVVWNILRKVLIEIDSFLESSPSQPDSTVSFWESMSSFSCFFWQSQNPEQSLHEKETNKLALFVSNLPLVLFSLPIKILYLFHQEISADKSIHLLLA